MSDNGVDLELVRRTQQGERGAFDRLVERYQHRIGHLLGRYLRNPAEIEDVAQETFIKAYRALAGFRGESAFYTWLYRIAVNTAKNHLAANSRRMLDQGVDASEAEQFDDGGLLRDIASPERVELTAEIGRTISAAVEALPGELREAITLREMEGMTYDEIAAVLACPIGTVRSRISRARAAIDRAIRPLMDDTDGGDGNR